MKDTNGVAKPRMRCPGKDELGNSKLLYSPKALELRCIDEIPSQLVQGNLLPEHDKSVDRIPNPLGARLTH